MSARTWLDAQRDAYANEGGRELAARDGKRWYLGLWLSIYHWGLGVGVEREHGCPSWPNRLHLAASFGPLTIGAVRTWEWKGVDS